ncbi:MAG: serine--tRNA ligase [Vicinamibacteria bacterium]|nr:serine--tRNA ligase [Vicinamibacteria bacterium]
MLDLRYVAENKDAILTMLKDRGDDPGKVFAEADPWSLDIRRREIIQRVEGLRHRQRLAGEEIARRGKAKEDTSGLKAEMKTVSDESKALDAELAAVERRLNDLMLIIPNIPDASVPRGDASANAVIRTVGEPRRFDFEPRSHVDIGLGLGIVDFERAAKISGARFASLWGPGARLERALIQFMLDLHTKEHGYLEIVPPYLVLPETLVGTGNLPKFEGDLFKTGTADRELYLIPTAEVPLTCLHRDEILEPEDLPKKFVAFTPCFRSEAGSYGKDVRGLIRQHQFHKVELVKVTAEDASAHEHEAMVSDAEAVLKRLELPYRVVLLASGDMGFGSARTYDIEVWLPGQNAYREISSLSNCRDFQARRAQIRYRKDHGGKPRFAHTLNGSGLAVGRTMVAILENFQQADGTVAIPGALRHYMDGIDLIGRSGNA